ncbi:Golgi membrane exchange factor (Ric1p-Rgp1p) subunit [Marasmius sp. AFHP31]|nr:Golgi membrane exchange factor (Ric1p-Rgp1p) subunit [Marasmius sp. AFHP31]
MDTDDDSPIRVQVTPSQTAYFAGEPFTVTITFTNTRSSSSTYTPGPSRLGHKRAAHSISSAPIARPPTSPAGQPRTPTTSHTFAREKEREKEGTIRTSNVQRKRLIGKEVGKEIIPPKGKDVLPDLIEQRRKRLLAKSLSLTISPGDLEAEVGSGFLRQAQQAQSQEQGESYSPSSPSVPSPLSRSESLALSSSHPHARKQSLLDGQTPIPSFSTTTTPLKSPLSTSVSAPATTDIGLRTPNTSTFTPGATANASSSISPPSSAPASVPPSPSTPSAAASASNSTFSLALDPIEEMSPSPRSPSPYTPTSPYPNFQHALYPAYSYPSAPSTPNPTMPSPSISIQSPSPPQKPLGRMMNGVNGIESTNEIGLGLPSTSGFQRGRPAPLDWNKPEKERKPNEESILYSYVQLKGSVVISSPPNTPPSSSLKRLRSTLLRGSVSAIGGGSMDITSSLSGSSLSGLSSPSLGGIPAGQRHRRSPSLAGLVMTGFGLGPSNPNISPVPSTSAPQLNGNPKGPTPIDSLPRRNSQGHRRSFSARPEIKSQSSSSWLWGGSTTPTTAASSYGVFPEEVDSGVVSMRNRASSANGYPSSSGSLSRMLGWSSSIDPPPSPLIASSISRRGEQEQDVDPDAPLPTFEVQPAMLNVDGVLGPGESQSFKYTLNLPSNLPPTFRGHHLQFSYELVVGICRGVGTENGGSVSKVMKVPIRIYNNVTVGRPPAPYDLLWPAAKRKRQLGIKGHRRGGAPISSKAVAEDQGKVEEIKDEKGSGKANNAGRDNADKADEGVQKERVRLRVGGQKEHESETQLKEYASKLLSGGILDEGEDTELIHDGRAKPVECGEAVEILTRVQKKVSYDVNKSGVKVAVLTFSKSAFRLGETVLGVVEVNERQSRARVLKLSAHLETSEVLPSYLSPTSPSPMKRLHASHHCNFVLGSLRTTFSLDIPSDASPAFQVFVDPSSDETSSHPYFEGQSSLPHSPHTTKPGGLEWKVRLSLLVALAAESADTGTEGVRIKSLVRDGERGEWGSGWAVPPRGCAILQKVPKSKPPPPSLGGGGGGFVRSWTSFFLGEDSQSEVDSLSVSSYDDDTEESGYDGIKPDRHGGVGTGVDFSGCSRGGEAEWEEVRTEMVECEVSIRVWPGNTAFRSVDVLFDV